MITAALALLAQSGTIAISGGLCPSAVAISLPDAPPGMSRVHVSVAVEHVFTHGWETDGVGTFSIAARFTGSWTLRAGSEVVCGARTQRWTSFANGDLVPFDHVWDWAGTSGDANVEGRSSAAGVTLPAGVPLVLSARASAPYSIALNVLGYGSCATLVRSEWSGVLAYTFVR